MTSSTRLERRLEEIRGGAPRRSPTVRVLAAHANHTDCRLAALGFAAGVSFDKLLAGTRFQVPFGQSPFAIARGLAFEKLLRDSGHAAALALLRPLLSLPAAACVVNLREGYPSGPDRMPLRARDTAALLGRILRGDPLAPHLIDGAVLSASIGGLTAYFEADALAARAGTAMRVAEVKSFPKVDDHVDPEKLGAALDQAAVYILLTREEVLRQGGDPERLVSDRALLITPKNVGLTPTLSEQRVEARVRRVGKLLDAIPSAADVAASAPAGLSFGPVADTAADERRRIDALHVLADRVGTAYQPSCQSSCGNARLCRARAFRDGSPCLSGTTTLRLLPGVPTLGRADELTRGAKATVEEAPAADLLERAGRLYDATAGVPPTGTVATSARRPA
jgi:hypothetical protein